MGKYLVKFMDKKEDKYLKYKIKPIFSFGYRNIDAFILKDRERDIFLFFNEKEIVYILFFCYLTKEEENYRWR